DLNGDKSDEFVFMTASRGLLYENHTGQWTLVGNVYPTHAGGPRRSIDLIDGLVEGDISAVPPKWSDLSIGGRLFKVNER
ncbi:MAG TPA: hypothetical protein VE109_02065, partial [Acidobacteriaceae bacterium]|nr:hypothetical protein [Acidobacteriaceae bacterium]